MNKTFATILITLFIVMNVSAVGIQMSVLRVWVGMSGSLGQNNYYWVTNQNNQYVINLGPCSGTDSEKAKARYAMALTAKSNGYLLNIEAPDAMANSDLSTVTGYTLIKTMSIE